VHNIESKTIFKTFLSLKSLKGVICHGINAPLSPRTAACFQVVETSSVRARVTGKFPFKVEATTTATNRQILSTKCETGERRHYTRGKDINEGIATGQFDAKKFVSGWEPKTGGLNPRSHGLGSV